MNTPTFINIDSQTIIAEIVAAYELESGKTLQPGQAEYLLINSFAYREKLIRESIQAAGIQMLLSFSSAPALDYLAELVGLVRLSASFSTATIDFNIVAGHGGVVIPANTRVASTDGKVVFSTSENITVPIGTNVASVTTFSSVSGVASNGYAIGTITEIMDPLAFLVSASNTDASAGGADAETDDALRERAKLAPAQFSVAGPIDAYIFFAKTASPTIIDVSVTSPVPGTVNVYPLVEGGITTPAGTITLVENALNDTKVRPLSDTVVVLSPTIQNYNIVIDVIIYDTADPTEVTETIEAALAAYGLAKSQKLGQDIKLDQINAAAIYDDTKVFETTITSPGVDIVATEIDVAVLGTVTVNITGTTNG